MDVTPIMKVIELLNNMVAKGAKEKHEEEARFASFKQWCQSTISEKERDIKLAGDEIDKLTADIAKAETDADKLGAEVSDLDADIDTWAAQGKKAAEVRKVERAEYVSEDEDYTDSISALEKAIQVLKSRKAEGPVRGEALVQEFESKAPKVAKALRPLLLQEDSSEELVGAPVANAYDFQSSGIIAMLENLRHRFQEEQGVLQKEEMNRKHNYEMLAQKLADDTQYAEKVRAEKVQAKSELLAQAADDKGALGETQAAKEADEKYLIDTKNMCHQKSTDYEERQKLRAEELEAIKKAIEIVSSKDVSGTNDKYLSAALLQRPSLAQLRAEPLSPSMQRVAALLQGASQKTGSGLLQALAKSATEDPFVKVRKMIKDLLVRLLEEANAEAEHKGWCDAELATNKQTREMASADVTELTSKVDELTALEAKLAQEIEDLSQAIAEIDAAMKEAQEEREKEKAANLVTIQEAKVAQEAVVEAIRILREFCEKAATATALAQQTPDSDSPFVFDEPYQGMQGSKGGVIGMMEVIQSDFARLESKTSTAEEEAQREFVEFTEKSESDKAVKDREMRHKGFAKDRASRDLRQSKKDLESAQKQLEAALAYYEKLKPSCINLGNSYEERKARRKEEIEALQEALAILNGNDLATPEE